MFDLFTGLVQEIGTIIEVKRLADAALITVECPAVSSEATLGDSIAVNGCCLTVTMIDRQAVTFDAMPETMDKTNLKKLVNGDIVNIEQALRADERLGGHIVTGHVDGTGFVGSIRHRTGAKEIEISMSGELLRQVVPKGSIALDGVSLTVIEAGSTMCKVGIIPFTLEHTIIGKWKQGTMVNIETDIIGKYVGQMLAQKATTLEDLVAGER